MEHEQTPSQPEKKIFVDEDWKAQVQAEKQRLSKQASPPSDKPGRPSMPTPSLSTLLTSLGVQALAALGLAPLPGKDKPQVDLETARYLIDTISMLQEKTQGNRTPEESAALEALLHELRMGFFAVHQSQQSPPAPPPQS